MRTYIKYSDLAPKLGYHGKRAPEAARKWCERRNLPRYNRAANPHRPGRPKWCVAEEDVEAAMRGKSFVKFPRSVAS